LGEELSRETLSGWSAENVRDWAKQFGESVSQKLFEEEVDGSALLLLSFQDMMYMGIPTGPRRRLLSVIALLNDVPFNSSPEQYLPPDHKPYRYLKNLITEDVARQIKEYYATSPLATVLTGNSKSYGDYKALNVGDRVYIPALDDRLEELFPEYMIFGIHYFSGDSPKGEYSGWHTGVNISKLFVGHPSVMSVWIPLQTLTKETGGRLWLYNGDYLQSIKDVLTRGDKKSQLTHYMIMNLFAKEMDAHKVTEDCQLGDGFLFSEMNPHSVDSDCSIPRDVLSVRMVKRGTPLDPDFMKELEEIKEDEMTNIVEPKRIMNQLLTLLKQFLNAYETSLAIDEKRRAEIEAK